MVIEPTFAAGEREESFDQPLLVLAVQQRPLAGGEERIDRGFGVGQRDLEQRPLDGHWGAELVGGIGDEVALGVEGCVQPGE